MAGMNEEEDYLHQLLENAMMQDARFEEDENQIDVGSSDGEIEPAAVTAENGHEDIIPDLHEESAEDDEIFDIFSGGESSEEAADFLAAEENTEDGLVLEDDFADIAGIVVPEEPDDEPFTDIVLDESTDIAVEPDEASVGVEDSSDDDIFSLDELMDSDEDESIAADGEPEEIVSLADEGLESDFLNELEELVGTEQEGGDAADADETVMADGNIDFTDEPVAVSDELNLDDLQGMYDESEQDEGIPDDILVLDEGGPFPEFSGEDADIIPTEDEPVSLLEDDADFAAVNSDAPDMPAGDEEAAKEVKKTKASKKKSKEKKEKRQKEKGEKKFSLKNFFMDEDEDSEDKTTDENQQLINELYENKSSLDDADPNDIDASVKKKKEKKVKEKKEKPKKEPKPKKVKEPKDKSQKGGFDAGLLFKAVLIAAVLVAAVIFGSKFFVYHSAVKNAREYFESGNYSAAYKRLSGIDVKEKDSELYMKIRTVMIVYNGLESYENYIALGDVPHALDALIMSVGRKNRNEELAIRYEVTNEVNSVYNRLIGMLDKYGISESQALDYFTMKDYEEYFSILESIGGRGSDSDN